MIDNKPLTADELLSIRSIQALWVRNLRDNNPARLMLVKKIVGDEWFCCCDFSGFVTFCIKDYGSDYLIYRDNPDQNNG